MRLKSILISCLLFVGGLASSQSFSLVPLGVHGGGEEDNLSAYLLSEYGKHEYIGLDAGTLRAGIDKAIEAGVFHQSNIEVLRKYIKGYFISHGHLDHVAGLIINSPSDSAKNIYGTPATIEVLKTKYFTNGSWTNFANEGEKPRLGKYTYKRATEGTLFSLENTQLSGRIFELSHSNPGKSSAILVSHPNGDAVLYLGDTGADRIEHSHNLEKLWTAVAPLIRSGKLKALLIEVSFPNEHPEDKLFGHLTPKLLNEELQVLARKAGLKDLSGLNVIITHMKPEADNVMKIKMQLTTHNPMKVDFIYPQQGEEIAL